MDTLHYRIIDHRYRRDSSQPKKVCGICGEGPDAHAHAGSRVPIGARRPRQIAKAS